MVCLSSFLDLSIGSSGKGGKQQQQAMLAEVEKMLPMSVHSSRYSTTTSRHRTTSKAMISWPSVHYVHSATSYSHSL
ncbi:hypothetical protein PPL_03089 [Heterostelium album PN500]|uniref:Uncharacterized protein n=1 Tax=Heterostelium pallidum (strain ATCC 26659 / Pp 5 / PN500) TaxID=670386 RepID=D3B3W8_HETP5|nr:hypothetical protein PPL_03089 [Heterostelium album PN500]EFA84016.1 hypothetical protein PPL_03089 [Heterostelium album PN500]|eukprot:XP_020436133.1 hypothetical protein PPL_03089 [Heterostelium album PN500]